MKTRVLADICLSIVDCAHSSAPRDEDGEYFAVGTPAMRGNVIDYAQARRISKATFEEWTTRLRPRVGDLLLAREAPVGPVVHIPPAENVAPGQRTVLLRPDSAVVDPQFLYYHLASPVVQMSMTAKASGSTVPHLNVADVRALPIFDLPALPGQRLISGLLVALDDKIAANDRLVEVLECLAELQWAKAVLPWKSVPLSSLAEFVNGKAFTRDATGHGRVVVRIAELNSGIGPSTVYNSIEVSDRHLARPGDLLFAWSGSLVVKRWFRPEAIINQHIFKVVPMNGYPEWLVAQALREKLDGFKAIAADKATTMGHIQRRHLDEQVAIPAHETIAAIDGLMGGLWDRSLAAERENLALATARDELLPLLMSGRIRVRDAEKVLEEVV